jgi:hypothetical protein
MWNSEQLPIYIYSYHREHTIWPENSQTESDFDKITKSKKYQRGTSHDLMRCISIFSLSYNVREEDADTQGQKDIRQLSTNWNIPFKQRVKS